MKDRIVITGIGIVSPLGSNVEEFWMHLNEKKTALRTWDDLADEGFRIPLACRVNDGDHEPMYRGRNMALDAAKQAIHAAGNFEEETDIFIGSTLGESFAFESAAEGVEVDLLQHGIDSFGKYIADELNLTGTQHATATACSAGNYAMAMALSSLKQGRIKRALVGGAEPFSKLASVGFSRSRAMASEYCKPFDRDRNGMMLGEGAAMFFIEFEKDALKRGASPLAELVSVGLTSDAHHATAPIPDGSGLRKAMQQALALGDINENDVDWINAHGSGTKLSDAAEGNAIKSLFNGNVPKVSGSKGALGHSLGAASAMELAICALGLYHQVIPPTYGFETIDPEVGITCTTHSENREIQYVLNNAMAFGGINSSILIKRYLNCT